MFSSYILDICLIYMYHTQVPVHWIPTIIPQGRLVSSFYTEETGISQGHTTEEEAMEILRKKSGSCGMSLSNITRLF